MPGREQAELSPTLHAWAPAPMPG
ncbi:hypothetical protein A2U01_0097881, partial [Trifolium medium]|nr:hypothetical protein [Trifolium medium]